MFIVYVSIEVDKIISLRKQQLNILFFVLKKKKNFLYCISHTKSKGNAKSNLYIYVNNYHNF